jgi:protein-S-isoprenylcysteine O-methyltransferase Ste14
MPPYPPGILIGLIVGAYWARVVKLVFKARKQTGRAANFVPPEMVGKILRVIWYPTVILWIVIPFLTGFAPTLPHPLRLFALPWPLFWLGVLIALTAFIATLFCWKRMGKSWRMGIDPNEKTQLIFTGPYAYVRHPIYALSSLMMLGSVLAVPSILMLVLGAIHLLFLQWEARREEQYLVQLHGPAYESYCRNVGRFLPKSLWRYGN